MTTVGTAAAAPHYATPPTVQFGYTDSADHKTAFNLAPDQREVPLGAWADASGRIHVSRIYATFDVTQFTGKTVDDGKVFIREVSAADCAKRAIEIWSTDTIEQTPSWADAPAAEQKLDDITTPNFCPASITFDVKAAVEKAVAKGKPRVSFEIRVPETAEKDVTFGRMLSAYSGVQLSVQYNSAPSIDPAQRYNGGFPCAQSAPFPRIKRNLLQALATDADAHDQHNVKYSYAVWPQDDPAARVELSNDYGSTTAAGRVELPADSFVDGRTYLWQARVTDGVATSAWSEPCGYVVDRTAPSAPQVTSSNYPPSGSEQPGPIGQPVKFTFSGNGDADTAGFEWTWMEFSVPGCPYGDFAVLMCSDPFESPNTVRADAPGGSATVALTTQYSGPARLQVRAVDAAGNRSAPVSYEIVVPEGAPRITVVGDEPEWGKPVTLRFEPYPGVEGVVDFEYSVDNAAPQIVAAGADGTATISFTAGNVNGHYVTARSRSASGWISRDGSWRHQFDLRPTVRSEVYPGGAEPTGGVGVQGTFTILPAPGMTDVQGYSYAIGWDQELTFVPAAADGSATVTWTPSESGFHNLEIIPVRHDGSWNFDGYRNHRFFVA
ncbi:CBM96 family carbohydrate-binding protein [Actinokineospora alba]|uniref:CBM96 family carbohydrate-binding protein n=1 Tax=Actinokineospora alba TaxID=504798 RepID=UPI00105DE17D|nr:hypothetical protein [Actinokineospora alba]